MTKAEFHKQLVDIDELAARALLQIDLMKKRAAPPGNVCTIGLAEVHRCLLEIFFRTQDSI